LWQAPANKSIRVIEEDNGSAESLAPA